MKSLLEASGGTLLMDIVKFFTSGSDKKPLSKPEEDEIYLGGSISNKTKQLVMTFPVLCDNTLPPSTASMINRANERNIVTMLQLLFSSISVSGKDGAKVLGQLHKNLSISSSMDDVISGIDDFVNQNSNFTESSPVRDVDIRRSVLVMKEQMKGQSKVFPINSFSETSLNDFDITNIHGRMIVSEAIKGERYNPHRPSDGGNTGYAPSSNGEQIDYNRELQKRQFDDYEKNRELQNAATRAKVRSDELNAQIKQRDLDNYDQKLVSDQLKTDQIRRALDYDAVTKQLLDTDVKKANEMVPTLMIVQYNELDKDGKFAARKPFVAGVKSRLISVDAADIVDRVVVKNKTKVNFLNFIRATTGEIKFFRDFLFCIDQAKIDAKNSVKKGEAAKMWKVLENRSSKNFHNKAKKTGNDASAITTLVINQETVNTIKKNYDFDIERVANAKMLLDAYNLLGIIIADESIEVVKFLYAGNDLYEQQAYSYLNKEQADNSYKKIINLISKMNVGR